VSVSIAERMHFEHIVVTFDAERCSDRNTVCLKYLRFPFIRQHQLWNDAYFRIAMVTASAGRLLQNTTVF